MHCVSHLRFELYFYLDYLYLLHTSLMENAFHCTTVSTHDKIQLLNLWHELSSHRWNSKNMPTFRFVIILRNPIKAYIYIITFIFSWIIWLWIRISASDEWHPIRVLRCLTHMYQHKSSNDVKKSHHGEDIEELPGIKVEECANKREDLLLLQRVGWMETDEELKHLRQTHTHTQH